MYPGWITDKVVEVIYYTMVSIGWLAIAVFVFGFFYTITLGIMSIVYLLN